MNNLSKNITYEWAGEPKVAIPDYPQAPNLVASLSILPHKGDLWQTTQDVQE
jgi:hypothetical protein